MRPLRACVLGAGLMGAQIGCEYALGGHEVALLERDPRAAMKRVEDALALLTALELASTAEAAAAARRLRHTQDVKDAAQECDVVVESLPEIFEVKVEKLGAAAAVAPSALLASNTSSLRISDIGREIGAADRTVGTHYWNPPLLMPLVEIVAGDDTSPERVRFASDLVRSLGKTAVVVKSDIPGFIWNRLQFAVVREAASLVTSGAVAPEDLDQIVRDGLARRWRHVGPLRAIALGGLDTWNAAARHIVPDLSTAASLPDLAEVAIQGGSTESDIVARDRGLARELVASRRTA